MSVFPIVVFQKETSIPTIHVQVLRQLQGGSFTLSTLLILEDSKGFQIPPHFSVGKWTIIAGDHYRSPMIIR